MDRDEMMKSLRDLRYKAAGDKIDLTDYYALSQAIDTLDQAHDDSARLDWMDSNWFSAYRQCDPIDGLSDHCVVVDESKRPRRGNVADGIREAIDLARPLPDPQPDGQEG